MIRVFTAALAIFAAPVLAQDNATRVGIAEHYLECYRMNLEPGSDSERLKCYDDLAEKMPAWLAGEDIPAASTKCEIESWNYRRKAGAAYITGSTTCRTGKLNYRLYDKSGDRFLTSGFTFIEGFAFQTYADVDKMPSEMFIRYTIED